MPIYTLSAVDRAALWISPTNFVLVFAFLSSCPSPTWQWFLCSCTGVLKAWRILRTGLRMARSSCRSGWDSACHFRSDRHFTTALVLYEISILLRQKFLRFRFLCHRTEIKSYESYSWVTLRIRNGKSYTKRQVVLLLLKVLRWTTVPSQISGATGPDTIFFRDLGTRKLIITWKLGRWKPSDRIWLNCSTNLSAFGIHV